MDLSHTLAHQLQQLRQQAEQADAVQRPGKPQNWFDTNLFSCRSPNLADYVAEAQRNLQHLRDSPALSAASTQRLVQRLSEQVNALTQAFRNITVRRAPSLTRTKVTQVLQQSSVSVQQLYQQLSDYQEFERRLLDMLSLESRHNNDEQVPRSLALHARLGRCRKAISDVELHIQQLERQTIL